MPTYRNPKRNNKTKNNKTKKKTVKKNYSFESINIDNLDNIEKKYCSCLMKVRSQKIPEPYAICTKSVYGSRDSVRDKVIKCSQNYNFSKYTLTQLKLYAKEKKMKGYSKLNKKQLLRKLQQKK